MTWTTYDTEPHVAEIYDRIVEDTDDVQLIRGLIGGAGPLRILEPFGIDGHNATSSSTQVPHDGSDCVSGCVDLDRHERLQ